MVVSGRPRGLRGSPHNPLLSHELSHRDTSHPSIASIELRRVVARCLRTEAWCAGPGGQGRGRRGRDPAWFRGGGWRSPPARNARSGLAAGPQRFSGAQSAPGPAEPPSGLLMIQSGTRSAAHSPANMRPRPAIALVVAPLVRLRA